MAHGNDCQSTYNSVLMTLAVLLPHPWVPAEELKDCRRWVTAILQQLAAAAGGGSYLRGKRGSPFSTRPPPGYWPHAAASGSRWSAGGPVRPIRRQISAA